VPPGAQGPLFEAHNHDTALAACPNGDLLAIWYSCVTERGRELVVAASRLRYGREAWDPADLFWGAPDRNNHAPALWSDGEGTLYHFNGMSTAATWGPLATVLRTSTDNGVTWSKARLIMPEHGVHHQPVESVFQTREGWIILPCDAVPGGSGLLGQSAVDVGQGLAAIDLRLARTQQIEVGAMQGQDLRHAVAFANAGQVRKRAV